MEDIAPILFVLTELLVFSLGLGLLALLVFYVVDRLQTQHSLRRDFPVLAHFRYLFEKLGEFFRQYFLSWIQKSCYLIVPSAVGCIAQLKGKTQP